MDATNDEVFNLGRARNRIGQLRRRAEKLNLSLRAICLRAGVCVSTVQRWESGATSPGLAAYGEALGRLERELTREEARLRAALAGGGA